MDPNFFPRSTVTALLCGFFLLLYGALAQLHLLPRVAVVLMCGEVKTVNIHWVDDGRPACTPSSQGKVSSIRRAVLAALCLPGLSGGNPWMELQLCTEVDPHVPVLSWRKESCKLVVLVMSPGLLNWFYQLWNCCFSQSASFLIELVILPCVAPLGECSLALWQLESSICIIEGGNHFYEIFIWKTFCFCRSSLWSDVRWCWYFIP